jgi:hypothetical protein
VDKPVGHIFKRLTHGAKFPSNMTAVTKIEISTFDISETSGPILAKLYYRGPWLVLFKNWGR